MSYLLKSKPKKRISDRVIIAFVIFIVLSVFAYFFTNFSRTIVYSVTRPVWAITEFSLKPFPFVYNFFKTKNSLVSENLNLKDEISILKSKVNDYDILTKQLDDLKTELGRSNFANKIASRILSRPPVSPYDTVVIDSGERDGVIVGNFVFVSNNIVVGKVDSVTVNTALVKLFSGPEEKNEVIVQRTGTSFELIGQGGSNFKIEVPKDTDIIWGDLLVYPNLSSAVVASVFFVDESVQNSFKTIYARVPVNVFSSKYFLVESQ